MLSTRARRLADAAGVAGLWTAANVARHAEIGLPLGLRTGETRLLRPEHVHLRDRHLDIVASKGNRSRRLPITGEVAEILADCDRVSAYGCMCPPAYT